LLGGSRDYPINRDPGETPAVQPDADRSRGHSGRLLSHQRKPDQELHDVD